MMVVDLKYNFGEVVYLKTDLEQRPRLMVSCVLMPGGLVQYNLSCGAEESSHYDFEISNEKDLSIA